MSAQERQEVRYHVEVNPTSEGATVTASSPVTLLKKGDTILFTSNLPEAAIRYRETSPFDEAEVGPGSLLILDRGKGPYTVVNIGEHHFDCGVMKDGQFHRWGAGADTPVGPRF